MIKMGPTQNIAPAAAMALLLEHAWLIAWGGLLVDLLLAVVLWANSPRLRALAICVGGTFHVSNHLLFHLESFPWVMLSSLALILPDTFWAADMRRTAPKSPSRRDNRRHARGRGGAALITRLAFGSLASVCVVVGVLAPLPCALALWSDYDDGKRQTKPQITQLSANSNSNLYSNLVNELTPGELSWGSTCQYFAWRMMLRHLGGQG